MSTPLVSVLITAFDREQFIAEAIESALSSTLTDLEVIVSDDCSTDGTWKVALGYAHLDSRVRVFRNDQNIGDNPNRNRAASYATGTYLKYLDSDDILYPHALSVLVAAMTAYPEAGFGLSENPDPSRPYPYRLTPHEAYLEHFLSIDLFGRAPGSSIICRSAFQAVDGFREFKGKGSLGDLELWLKLARRFDVVKVPRDLVWDRRHENQESAFQQRTPLLRATIDRQLHLEALGASDCPLTSSERRAAIRRLHELDSIDVARLAIVNRKPVQAMRYARAVDLPITAFLRVCASRLTSRS